MRELIDYLANLDYKNQDEINRVVPLLEKYMENILIYNKKVNVTSIRERQPFIRKHYIDSISIINKPEFIDAQNVIDIGTGGGFPGVPLAALFPDKKFILVDSVAKKINVIKESIKELNLNNIEFVIERAELLGRMKEHREMYDLCVSRAVAPLNLLLEFSLPLVKPGGFFIAYKGPDGIGETEKAENILKRLGGKLNSIDHISPFSEVDNHILMVFEKDFKTPDEYPRRMDVIKRDKK